MTLAKRHYQRLWFPRPGEGGAIPSRAEHAMTRQEFDQAMPEERHNWAGQPSSLQLLHGTLKMLAFACLAIDGSFCGVKKIAGGVIGLERHLRHDVQQIDLGCCTLQQSSCPAHGFNRGDFSSGANQDFLQRGGHRSSDQEVGMDLTRQLAARRTQVEQPQAAFTQRLPAAHRLGLGAEIAGGVTEQGQQIVHCEICQLHQRQRGKHRQSLEETERGTDAEDDGNSPEHLVCDIRDAHEKRKNAQR